MGREGGRDGAVGVGPQDLVLQHADQVRPTEQEANGNGKSQSRIQSLTVVCVFLPDARTYTSYTRIHVVAAHQTLVEAFSKS